MTQDRNHSENGQAPTGFGQIPRTYLFDPSRQKMRLSDVLILETLYGYRNVKSGEAYPALETVATATGYTSRTVRRAYRRLTKAGRISTTDSYRNGVRAVVVTFPEAPTIRTRRVSESSDGQSGQLGPRIRTVRAEDPDSWGRGSGHPGCPPNIGTEKQSNTQAAKPLVDACAALLIGVGIPETMARQVLGKTALNDDQIRAWVEAAKSKADNPAGYLISVLPSAVGGPTSESTGRGHSNGDGTNPCGPPPFIDWSDCKPLSAYRDEAKP